MDVLLTILSVLLGPAATMGPLFFVIWKTTGEGR